MTQMKWVIQSIHARIMYQNRPGASSEAMSKAQGKGWRLKELSGKLGEEKSKDERGIQMTRPEPSQFHSKRKVNSSTGFGLVSPRQARPFWFGKGTQNHFHPDVVLRMPYEAHRPRRLHTSLCAESARRSSGVGCTSRPRQRRQEKVQIPSSLRQTHNQRFDPSFSFLLQRFDPSFLLQPKI